MRHDFHQVILSQILFIYTLIIFSEIEKQPTLVNSEAAPISICDAFSPGEPNALRARRIHPPRVEGSSVYQACAGAAQDLAAGLGAGAGVGVWRVNRY